MLAVFCSLLHQVLEAKRADIVSLNSDLTSMDDAAREKAKEARAALAEASERLDALAVAKRLGGAPGSEH